MSTHQMRAYFSNWLLHSGMKEKYIEYMMGHKVDNYNSAYVNFPAELLIDAYRERVHAVDPYFDEEKAAKEKEVETLKALVKSNAERLDRLENESVARNLKDVFSSMGGCEREAEIVRDETEIVERAKNGWAIYPLGKRSYIAVRPRGQQNDG
jgi:hypothetical protein